MLNEFIKTFYTHVGNMNVTHLAIGSLINFINIIINNPVISSNEEPLCLAVDGHKLIYTTDLSNPNSQFFLLKKGKFYCFAKYNSDNKMLQKHSSNRGISTYTPYSEQLFGMLRMDGNYMVLANGEKNMIDADWLIIT